MPSYTYQNLITWSTGMLGWQRDLLRRLLTTGEATDADISELADLACPTVSSVASSLVSPVFATNDHIPTGGSELPVVHLEEVSDISRVNALSAGPVWFGSDGLTIVYGDTGAGKSGLVRILKKACRAKDPGGPLLSNVFDEPTTEPATATIKFRVDGTPKTHRWVEGEAADPALSTVHVFDAQCAAVQVEQASVISYTPSLVKIFQELAEATLRVQAELRTRRTALGKPPTFLGTLGLSPDTAAGRFVTTLSENSEEQALEDLATLSESEIERLDQLDRALRDDPNRAAQAEETRLRNMNEIQGLMAQAHVTLSDDVLDGIQRTIADRTDAREAALAAQREFARDSQVRGLGGVVWRRLWEAARHYSEGHAYPAGPFPVASDGAVCVLCQQSLSGEAQTRLHSFEQFVQSDLQHQADEVDERVANMTGEVLALELPTASRKIVAAVGLLSEAIGREIRAVLIGGRLRQRYMLACSRGSIGLTRPELPTPPSLAAVITSAAQEVGRLQAASRAADRADMVAERAELRDRKTIAPHVEAIKSEISRLISVALLDQAAEACRTNRMTLQGGRAAKAIITDRLRTSFVTNLRDIGFSGTPVEVQLAGC